MASLPPLCPCSGCKRFRRKRWRQLRNSRYHKYCCAGCIKSGGVVHYENCGQQDFLQWASTAQSSESSQVSDVSDHCLDATRSKSRSPRSVQYSLLESHILDLCQANPIVSIQWTKVFLLRAQASLMPLTRSTSSGTALLDKPNVEGTIEFVVFGTETHGDMVVLTYPGMPCINCSQIDCTSMGTPQRGQVKLQAGRESVLLQRGLIPQMATVLALQSMFELVLAGHRRIGFRCLYGKLPSLTTAQIGKELMNVPCRIYAYHRNMHI